MAVVDRAAVGTAAVVEDVAVESERLVGIALNLEQIMEGFKTTGGNRKALASK
jgi:hypothetical protein